jgi:RND family efflux transporter MFP subunit
MRLVRRLIPILVLTLAGGGLFVGYRTVASRPPVIDVATSTTEDVVRLLAVTGRIRPRLSNSVQPLVSGTVTSLTRNEGDPVRRGDVLATLDAQGSQAVIEQATAQLAARRVDVDQRQREFDRLQRLVTAGGLPERDAEQAKFALESAREGVRQFEALISESRSRLRDFTLRSPIDGYVLARPVDPGQNVTPQTVIYEIATGTGAEIEVEIDEQYLGELKLGLPARVSPLTGERTEYGAAIDYIGRRVSETSGAVPVRLRFTSAAPRLPVGLSVDVNLEIARHPGAVTVPRVAVAGLGVDPFVMAVRGDTVRRLAVKVIDWPSERIVVQQGLKAGDTLVLAPKSVRAGLAVRPRFPPDAL